MSANSFGNRFVITTFGESHGPALGVVVDGCPAGVPFDEALLNQELKKRRPGSHDGGAETPVSSRKEPDMPEILSGVYQDHTLGTPIAIIVRNIDARPDDYKKIFKNPRPGHADDLWSSKFGIADLHGGGRASGRETVARVMGGAVAKMFLKQACPSLSVMGVIKQIGPLKLTGQEPTEFLVEAKQSGKSYGGIAEVIVNGVPAFLGQPVFHKLKSDLTAAIMGIGATAGVEIGDGFDSASQEGSVFHTGQQSKYGGMRGGISDGHRIIIKAAFKPPSSVLETATSGRHDPCVVPRAIPVMEAMINLVIADHLLWSRSDKLS
ncbi:MAG: chorismate synthase [Bdellovibrionota bacterium]